MNYQETLDQLKKMLDEIIKSIPNLKENIDEFSDWNSPSEWIRNATQITELLTKLIVAVKWIKETVGGIDFTDDELLDAATQKLDDLIVLPFYLEPFDGVAIKFALKLAIDKAKKIIDKYKGDGLQHAYIDAAIGAVASYRSANIA
jgi:hypothetical protein